MTRLSESLHSNAPGLVSRPQGLNGLVGSASADTIQRFPLLTVIAMVSPTLADGLPAHPSLVLSRLVLQYRALAEVTEQLTYRLIDLEERLADQQRQMAALIGQAQAAELGQESLQRLEQTDSRLAQIEALLAGAGSPLSMRSRAPRRGNGMPLVSGALVDQEPIEAEAVSIAEDIFPEEPEQPFMDDDLQMPLAG